MTTATMDRNPSDPTFTLVEDGYNIIADTYLQWSQKRTVVERDRLVTKLIDILPTGASVLELGCGAGIPVTQQLVSSKLQVTGVDISKAQIDLARLHVPHATLVHANMLSQDFESKVGVTPLQFDAVVALYSLFHIPKDLQEEVLNKIIGWLKPGGILLFNQNAEGGEHSYEDWMGAPMFSYSPGVDGIRKLLSVHADALSILEDNVVEEPLGKTATAPFHWILARRL